MFSALSPSYPTKRKAPFPLVLLAGLYRMGYKLHHRFFLKPGKPLSHAKLIVVGSFLAGGAGKTPFCIWLAEKLHRDAPGNVMGTLTRMTASSARIETALENGQQGDSGFRRNGSESCTKCNGDQVTSNSDVRIAILCHRKAKDEAALLQWRLPFAKVLTTGNRHETALAIDQQFDYIICDDGFEDSRLVGAYTIRLDWTPAPTRWRDLLPAGRFRSLLQDHPHADAIFACRSGDVPSDVPDDVLRDVPGDEQSCSEPSSDDTTHSPHGDPGDVPIRDAAPTSVPGGTSRSITFFISEITNCAGESLSRQVPHRVSALCGIGNPYRFFSDLKSRGFTCERCLALPDHADNFEQAIAKILDDGIVVITEKDWIKLSDSLKNDPRIFVARQSLSVHM